MRGILIGGGLPQGVSWFKWECIYGKNGETSASKRAPRPPPPPAPVLIPEERVKYDFFIRE